VINSNFGLILHRFWDTTTYWLKIGYFSYPSLIRRPRSLCFRWNFRVPFRVRKLESWGYSVVKVRNPNCNRLWLIHPCDRQRDRRTDRQTDRQTDRRTGDSKERAIAYMLSRAKNSSSLYLTFFKTTVRLHTTLMKHLKRFMEKGIPQNWKPLIEQNLNLDVSRYLKLFGREIIFEVFQSMWSRYLNVTVGRTDGQTDGQTERQHIVA